MLCDRVLRNLGDDRPGSGIAVPLTWQECRARAIQKALPDGRPLRVILPPGVILRHGDVIHDEPGELIHIDLIPTDVLAIQANADQQVGLIYAFGNLHLPLQVDGGQIITPADGPAMTVLRELGLTAVRDRRRFDPLPLPNGLSFRLSDDFGLTRT
jgi:urease accessory protein UreE